MPSSQSKKRENLEQCAALCWRDTGADVQVLLITSRNTGRWVVPRGWLIVGKTHVETAVQEAWEEAGIRGKPHPVPLGTYYYRKPELQAEISVAVFALRVDTCAKSYPERRQRKRKWISAHLAAELIEEEGLAEMIRSFAR